MSPEGIPNSTESGDAFIGSVLAGRYRILKLLGTGAMGAVYLGEHLKIGRQDAIKVLHKSMERDPEAIARFTRGARNASTIRHPNVCTVYDFGETADQRAFLAMEYVQGEQLSDLLARQGRIDPQRAIRLTIQAADALEAAHHHGIVHRDLKPGNIMIGRDREGADVVKVVDFDIAKGDVEGEEDEVTRLGYVVGTPEYMSPEQLTGDPLDGRSDLYSLGLVLFKALTGGYPFPAESTQELMVKKLTEPPLTLAEVADGASFPPGLQTFLDRCLERKAPDRFENASDLGGALRAILNATSAAEPVSVSAAPGPPPDVPPTETVATTVPPTVSTAQASGADRPGVPRWVIGVGLGVAATAALGLWQMGGSSGTVALDVQPSSLTLSVGETARLAASVLSDGQPVADAAVEWVSSDAGVASVSSTGLVTALEPGQAIVRSSFAGVEASVAVAIDDDATTTLTLEPPELVINAVAGRAGETQRVRVSGDEPLDGVTLAVEAAEGGQAAWIDVTSLVDGQDTWVEVRADASDLTAGEYRGRVLVDAGAGGGTASFAVRLTVATAPTPPPSDRITIAAGEVDALLSRQLGHLTGSGGAPARAVRDTVDAVLQLASLTAAQRARGHYVQASAVWELGDACGALRLSEESVALAPTSDAYETLRTQLSELCR